MSTVWSLLPILAVMVIGVISPGPNFLLVARATVAVSRMAGMAAALGTAAGACVLAIAALLGLGALLRQMPVAFTVIKIAGGLYLLYLAWKTWRNADMPLQVSAEPAARAGRGSRQFGIAFLTLLGNPKAAIMYGVVFAALLPPVPTRALMLALPPSIFALEMLWYVLVVLTLSAPRTRRVYLRAKGGIDRTAGAVFGLLGLRLLLATR